MHHAAQSLCSAHTWTIEERETTRERGQVTCARGVTRLGRVGRPGPAPEASSTPALVLTAHSHDSAPQDSRRNRPLGPSVRRRWPLARAGAGVSCGEDGQSARAAHLASVDAPVRAARASSSVAVPGDSRSYHSALAACSCIAAAPLVEGGTPPCPPQQPSPRRSAPRWPGAALNPKLPASCQATRRRSQQSSKGL